MITHVVAWTLKPELDRDASIERIRSLLVALDGVVPSIRSIEVVANVAYPDQNADVAVHATFDDLAGLEEYQTHPSHVEAAAGVRELVTGRAAIDWES